MHSLKSQKNILTNYSHARQVEVVASLGTATIVEKISSAHGDQRRHNGSVGEIEKQEDWQDDATTAVDAAASVQTLDGMDDAALAAIALEADMVRTKLI